MQRQCAHRNFKLVNTKKRERKGRIMTESAGADPAWVPEVLTFWFDKLGRKSWFVKDAAIDDEIRTRFKPLIDEKIRAARPFTYEEWTRRSLPVKLRDGIARLASPYL